MTDYTPTLTVDKLIEKLLGIKDKGFGRLPVLVGGDLAGFCRLADKYVSIDPIEVEKGKF